MHTGLQLKDLTNQQKDELALLIAERSVVFFRDQDITPQQQKELGEYYGKIEVHPQTPQVPGVSGVTASPPSPSCNFLLKFHVSRLFGQHSKLRR